MRVLLVEDDHLLATGVETALSREGYAVDHAATAAEALRFASCNEAFQI